MRTLTPRDERLTRARAQVAPFALSYARFVRECRVHVASLSADELRALIADTDLLGVTNCGWEEYAAGYTLRAEARIRLELQALPAPGDVPVEGAVPTAIQGAWNDAGETP